MPDSGAFAVAASSVVPLDQGAMADAAARQDVLTKPRGALGRLEALSIQLAGIAGSSPPPAPSPAAVAVFAADHGVHAQGVTPWPQEVTAQMVVNFAGGGAAINVLARQFGASVTVVDVGVATALPDGLPGTVLPARVRPGTADMTVDAAMSPAECRQALDLGAEVAVSLVARGAMALVTGEMGIGNTTASAALVAALLDRPPAEVTGRGTGVDDEGLARKVAVVEAALARHADVVASGDPEAILAAVGGLEIAALAGYVVGGAAAGVPVVVDGLIADAALLVAQRLVPGVSARCIAGHRSSEPGATAVLDALGLDPVLDLGLRLGEGSGACLALPVIEAAARTLAEMATFDAAGVTDKEP